jgi:hypothetical protein
MADCAFTESHYREILESFAAAGYQFTSFAGFDRRTNRQVILRHDVDLSLEDALRIARLEREMGIASVFFILVTAEVYNPMSSSGQSVLSELRQLGHQIGLHVDGTALSTDSDDVNARHERLRSLFQTAQQVLGPLDSYSLHRPATSGNPEEFQPSNLSFAVPAYAYAEEYFKRIEYRSDSRRQWRHGCICGQVRDLAGRSLQLVIHPVWWQPTLSTREEVLQRFKLQQQHRVEAYLGKNLSFYLPCPDGSVPGT